MQNKCLKNVASTGEQIVQAYNELKTANQTFIQSKVVEQPKTLKEKLQMNIESAKSSSEKSTSCKCNRRFSEIIESKNYSGRICVKRCESKRYTSRNDESYDGICDFTR